jgi:hypothetical protein
MALAENSGLSPIETLANIKSRQAKEKNTRLGVDCMQTGSNGKSFVPFCSFCLISSGSRLRGCQQYDVPFVSAAVVGIRHSVGSRKLRGPVVHPSSRVKRLHGMPHVPPHATPTHREIQRCNHEWKLDGSQERHCFAAGTSPASLNTFVAGTTWIRANVAFCRHEGALCN